MKRIPSLLFLLLILAGCRMNRSSNLPGKDLFTQERCVECHRIPMAALGGKYGNDWHYAHFWDPRLVVAGSTMRSYSFLFDKMKVTLSNKSYVTPGGERRPAFNRTPVLGKFFSFNPANFFYLFVSDSSWKTLPPGMKAFSTGFPVPGQKLDSTPVAWAPGKLREKLKPGGKIVLLIPKVRLRKIVDDLQAASPAANPDWLGTTVAGPPQSGNLKQGRGVYESRCAGCHGIHGDGDGAASVFLYPKPRDFRSGEYKFKTTLSDESPSDADLYRTISSGMRMTAMPGWTSLSPKERWSVIAYIKTFAVDPETKKNAFDLRPAQHVLKLRQPSLASGEEDARVKQGEALFFGKGKCNDCHGPGAHVLVDDWGYPVWPADLAGGTLKRGNSPKEIYLTITLGLMGTPMPPYHDNLTDRERWNLAFYVSRINRSHARSK